MNFIKLRFSGENIDFDKITVATCISPKFVCRKDDIGCNKITKQSIVYSEDCWIAETEVDQDDETEEKILTFIESLYQNKNEIRKLSDVYHATLWITLYQDRTQYNLHFSCETLRKAEELGFSIDVTCMQLQDFYSGAYLTDENA